MQNRQIDNKITKQVRIDSGVHRILKVQSSRARKSIKEYVENILIEYWNKEDIKWE